METYVDDLGDTVTISLEVIYIDTKAIFATDGYIRVWFPLRAVAYEDNLQPDTLVDFTMAEWYAEEKGLV